jgi:hypothetical protein
MIIIIKNNNDDEIKFKAENVIDGMAIGIMKEKFAKKGIPVQMTMKHSDSKILEITIKQKDLLGLLI